MHDIPRPPYVVYGLLCAPWNGDGILRNDASVSASASLSDERGARNVAYFALLVLMDALQTKVTAGGGLEGKAIARIFQRPRAVPSVPISSRGTVGRADSSVTMTKLGNRVLNRSEQAKK